MTILKRPQAWFLVGLGLSGQVPFLLVGSTLGAWLRTSGISLTLIGFTQWIGLFYAFKFLWAPFFESLRIPFLSDWLGSRRALILTTQILTGLVLWGMSRIDPAQNFGAFLGIGLALAFCASSQEIANDAWRVDATINAADQAIFPVAYSLGIKLGVLGSSALVFWLAERLSWPSAFALMGLSQIIGIVTVLSVPRPQTMDGKVAPSCHRRGHWALWHQISDPVISFWRQHPRTAGLILLSLMLYRFPDFLIGPMVVPMYTDTHISNNMITSLRGTVGLAAGFISVAIASFCLLRFGLERTFLAGAILGPVSNLMFSAMSLVHGSALLFAATLVVDDFGDGIAETALVAFMTRFTHRDHVVGHYALMYSAAAMPGKLLKGFSGALIDEVRPNLGLYGAYAVFFAVTAVLCVPTLLCCLALRQRGVFGALKTG